MFKNKTILITGGTGSFGNVVLNYFLDKGVSEIRIFSRDEKKQDDLRKCYKNSKFREVLITFESPELINQKKFNVRQRWHIYKKENINIHKQKKDYLFLNLGEIQ